MRDNEWSLETRGALQVLPLWSLRAHGVDAFMTTRHGGVSGAPYDSLNLGDHVGDVAGDVRRNRQLVAEAVGVSLNDLVFVRQVHGVGSVDGDTVNGVVDADVVVLATSSRAAAVMVADCVPVVMVDPTARRLAVLHAGWRGLALGVVTKSVATLTPTPEKVRVVVGPSISVDAYQVGPEVAAQFLDVPNAVMPDAGDRSRLDLRAVVRAQLRASGVADDAITTVPHSTDGGGTFFSDRAQRPCGRCALVAKWSP